MEEKLASNLSREYDKAKKAAYNAIVEKRATTTEEVRQLVCDLLDHRENYPFKHATTEFKLEYGPKSLELSTKEDSLLETTLYHNEPSKIHEGTVRYMAANNLDDGFIVKHKGGNYLIQTKFNDDLNPDNIIKMTATKLEDIATL